MRGLLPVTALLAVASAAPAPFGSSNPTADDTIVLITSNPPRGVHSCLRSSYHGTYGSRQDEHVYLADEDCVNRQGALATLAEGSGSMNALSRSALDKGRLVWVGHAGVEGKQDEDASAAWDGMRDLAARAAMTFEQESAIPSGDESGPAQLVIGAHAASGRTGGIEVDAPELGLILLHQSAASMLLHVPHALLPIVDTLLPSHLVPVAVPLKPLPAPAGMSDADHDAISATEWKTVPERFGKHLANLTEHLKFNPALDSILQGLDMGQVRRNVRWLTGEAPSGITSRHSFTPGAIKAGNWIAAQMESFGASCEKFPFMDGFAPDIICRYPSSTNSSELVILSAHYDSRGSFGSTTAPGGDDDGSGSGHLLAVGQAIGEAGLKFDKPVTLAFFAGEEQGLYGSHAFAEHLYNQNATVLLHVQADMLGYHAPGEPLQLGLPESIHLPEASYLLGNISQLYAPELLVGTTPACCSDHQSFLSYGFPASAVFERNGWIADPMYHNSGDVSSREGYDFDQIVSIAKVTMGSVLTVAGWSK